MVQLCGHQKCHGPIIFQSKRLNFEDVEYEIPWIYIGPATKIISIDRAIEKKWTVVYEANIKKVVCIFYNYFGHSILKDEEFIWI